MTNEELNTALYKKVFAEQEKYREWLLSQPPNEILNHCYEYTVREDIVLALEEYDLSDKQCKALLKSPCPLADVFKDFEKRETDHMPKMRFHDLRHSCASLLLANGVPLKQIQEWLGHSDFSTTANIYAHLDYRSKISSAQAMEQGMLLPRSDDFGSRWENVTEQGEITGPDSNPVFD